MIFEELLAAPCEQFDQRSELLAALLASIKDFASATSDTPSSPPLDQINEEER